jgi:hypothetical protein
MIRPQSRAECRFAPRVSSIKQGIFGILAAADASLAKLANISYRSDLLEIHLVSRFPPADSSDVPRVDFTA